MPYNLTTLENGCRELGIELSQKQKNQFIQFYESRQPVLRKSD